MMLWVVLFLSLQSCLLCASLHIKRDIFPAQEPALFELGDFSFSTLGTLSLSATPLLPPSSPSSLSLSWFVVLLPQQTWNRLLFSLHPLFSSCNVHHINVKTYSFPLANIPSDTSFQTLIPQGDYKILLVFLDDTSNNSTCGKHTINMWEAKKKDLSSMQPNIRLDLRFQNWNYGVFRESSLFPHWRSGVFTCGEFLVLLLLVRFQFITVQLMWKNTGRSLSLVLFLGVFFHLVKTTVSVAQGLLFLMTGNEHHDESTMQWEETCLDLAYFVVLVQLSLGWMTVSPQWTMPKTWLLWAYLTYALVCIFIPNREGICRMLIFALVYAEFVRLMKVSRNFSGAQLRGKVFSPIGFVLVLWGLGLPRVLGCIVLVWTFRAEVLWELHRERPHADVAKMLEKPSGVVNEVEEGENLLL